MDRHRLGQRLRALRAAQGRTVAAVAADAGLSVPYVANLEHGRGNPTLDAVSRIAGALGTRATIRFDADDDSGDDGRAVLPGSLVRLGRSERFRRSVRAMAVQLDEDPVALSGRVLDALAGLAGLTGRELGEGDWLRLLDAVLLVAVHPDGG
ncbi:helix-turn-helix transcriptional regulator [Dactylosporangium sp. AC04546]|uniref:helix-turn-helix domain-containing protein n=1 Tax=Dactylosporangium sp. AC04546 TaxID=2862460 RepID=UPI001EDE1A91|nr:helix-turn-helix transcriptional regulator [Dactylosporangium sp. AC04546]WVK89406.1 helix-turn-helix transcriptional regulator [Dactylosporangium sp. AC04546]